MTKQQQAIYDARTLEGVLLNAVLPGKDYESGAIPQGDKAVDFEVNRVEKL